MRSRQEQDAEVRLRVKRLGLAAVVAFGPQVAVAVAGEDGQDVVGRFSRSGKRTATGQKPLGVEKEGLDVGIGPGAASLRRLASVEGPEDPGRRRRGHLEGPRKGAATRVVVRDDRADVFARKGPGRRLRPVLAEAVEVASLGIGHAAPVGVVDDAVGLSSSVSVRFAVQAIVLVFDERRAQLRA